MKIVTVVGARPQFVKAAMVSRALQQFHDIHEVLVHTGQHFDRDMSDIFFHELDLPEPDHHLDVHSLSHAVMTAEMLTRLETVLHQEKPDVVLVYGDTNSTLAGALTAAKLWIPVAHVEAGLRSFNMAMPEEINRVVTDRLATHLFCPTATAVANLKREGMDHFGATVLNVGDVMFDAAMLYTPKARERSDILSRLSLEEFALCTIHRAENTNDPARLRGIIAALETIHHDLPVLLPLHPRTRKIMLEAGIDTHIRLIDPVSYLDMLCLLQECTLVLTDSGGLQKEAFFYKKSCVTLRLETEWTELVDAGVNFLAGHDTAQIVATFHRAGESEPNFDIHPYGDGHAAEKIATALRT
uniref:UDP-N-acetylglucosamine 2-epimerase n=1 Tax=uncultured bacterium pAW1 TaxID=1781155 RepID=A0A1C9U4Q1_9BACT|nr:UDP-N-acetylglucosamine 2-epimerase [uncultured bacterium pAW1]